ncbi:MAG: SdpI family protein [Dokdonia sp.]|jgi:uncharacterized membrane protein
MNLRKELPSLAIVVLPFLYLGFIYPELPNTVPTHWNGQGVIDAWGPKHSLWLIPFFMPVLTYVLLLVVPKIDPKGQLKHMGSKFDKFKFIITLFMSVLAMYIIYATQQQSLGSIKIIFVLMGCLFAAIGNYLPAVKPNYFIGIRTPWTLENQTVWKKTHRLSGRIWVIGGLIIVVLSLLLAPTLALTLFITITILLVVIPLVYSYRLFKTISASSA